jgi:nitrogen fixation/metabolism regulation signal transduction histidine kinase
MISRNFYLQIVVRVLVMAILALLLAWIIFGTAANLLALVPLAGLVAMVINTVHYLNRVNRRIFFFFDAIRNEDSSLSFPEEGLGKIEKELSRSLLEVNRHIQRIYEANQKQEQYFQALIGHAATGMFTFNAKGFILHSNHQARALLGLEPFTHLSQLEAIDQRLYRVVQEIRPDQQQLTALQREEGAVQLLMKASAFHSGGEELMLLSVQDIRHELDEKEIDSWRKLIQVMRHEIMNSVTPITSLSEGLRGYFLEGGRVKSPAQIDEKTISTTLGGLELIHEQALGLLRFVESYRQLTRMPEPEKRSFYVRKLMDNIRILAQSYPNAEKTELVCETEPEDLELLADEKQISQVMVNLVRNAFQATEQVESPRVRISAGLDKSGHPRIIISDNGPGIPDDILDKIFIPFFTTKEKGSGIGLSLSRQIMQMHGGSLKVTSLPGASTSVVLLFRNSLESMQRSRR